MLISPGTGHRKAWCLLSRPSMPGRPSYSGAATAVNHPLKRQLTPLPGAWWPLNSLPSANRSAGSTLTLSHSPDRPLEYIRRVVQLRHHLRRYFYAGEMGRPPRITGNIPVLNADWEWANFGQPWVSEPALFSGAWVLPQEKRLVLVFANAATEAYDRGSANRSGSLWVERQPVEFASSG